MIFLASASATSAVMPKTANVLMWISRQAPPSPGWRDSLKWGIGILLTRHRRAVDVLQRSDTYHQFIAKFPTAQFIGLKYGGAVIGEVAIGEQGRTAVAAFAGVYRGDGSLVAERVITDSDLPSPQTIQGHDPFHAFKLAADLCDGLAGVPRTS